MKPQCEGKTRFDKKSAVSFVHRMREQRGKLFRAYPCPVCNGWHVTTKGRDYEKLG